MEQLEDADAEDGEHFGIEPGGRPSGERLDDVIEGSLPAQRPRGNLTRERAIALVLQFGARASEGRGEVGASGRDREDRFVRGDSRRGDHGSKRAPSATPRPARNSRAVMVRRPSGWISRI